MKRVFVLWLTTLLAVSACFALFLSACRPKTDRMTGWEAALWELDRTLAREQSINQVLDSVLAELKKRMPFADLDKFAENPKVQEFGNILTVGDMVRFVASKVA